MKGVFICNKRVWLSQLTDGDFHRFWTNKTNKRSNRQMRQYTRTVLQMNPPYFIFLFQRYSLVRNSLSFCMFVCFYFVVVQFIVCLNHFLFILSKDPQTRTRRQRTALNTLRQRSRAWFENLDTWIARWSINRIRLFESFTGNGIDDPYCLRYHHRLPSAVLGVS